MLPSTGLFKSYTCPYFDGGGGNSGTNKGTAVPGTCLRPYCHFKHVRKDEEQKIAQPAPAVPQYKAAPKLLTLSLPTDIVAPKKRERLEYQPEKPDFNASPSKRPSEDLFKAPVYIPSSSRSNSLIDVSDELNELSDILNDELMQDEEPKVVVKIEKTDDEVEEALRKCDGMLDPSIKIKQEPVEDKRKQRSSSSGSKDPGKDRKTSEDRIKDRIKSEDRSKDRKSTEDRSKDRKSTEDRSKERKASEDRSKESKTSEDRSKERKTSEDRKTSEERRRERDKKERDRDREKDKEKQKEKEKERDREKYKERHREKAKEQEHEKHSKSDRDREAHKERDAKSERSSSRSKTATSSSSSSGVSSSKSSRHHHSSSSSSSSRTHRKPDDKDQKSTSSSSGKASSLSSLSNDHQKLTTVLKDGNSNAKEVPKILIKTEPEEDDSQLIKTMNADIFATSEEDILKECKMIFEQVEQEIAMRQKADQEKAAINGEDKNKLESAGVKRKLSEEDDAADLIIKKRVAHENADRHKPPEAKPVQRKPNHTQNAIRSIFERQLEVERKRKADEEAAQAAVREAEEKLRLANEELSKTQNLTLLIPKNVTNPQPVRTPRYTFAPAANILALERAKKKVDELRAERQPAFTLAKTSKPGQRIAHSATASTLSKAATSATGNATNTTEPAKKPPVLDPHDTKISFNIRMQYYEMMVKHCQAIYPNIADAWERAQTEELAVLKKCLTPVIYKSSALLAINKLRKEASDSGNQPVTQKLVSHEVILAGKLANNTSWSVQKKMRTDARQGSGAVEPFDRLPGDKVYDMVFELRLSEDQLAANGFPQCGKRKGTAIIKNAGKATRRPNATERYCCRCGKVFSLDIYERICVDECNYHPKSAGYQRNYNDNHHRCCQQPAGTPGCTYANYHVTDYYNKNNLTGYVQTLDKDEGYISTKKDIFALDCEMCYTVEGIELTRVTVVDINGRTVYDALVKPDNKIVDYNTKYSGITEEMLANETRNIRDVQAILLSMFHSKTILVGHSLESDFKALKLLHSVVVDTSVLFPHKMGPPMKRALKTLCVENLKRIIQENEAGHDSAEDAEVCIQLVKFYLRNKIS